MLHAVVIKGGGHAFYFSSLILFLGLSSVWRFIFFTAVPTKRSLGMLHPVHFRCGRFKVWLHLRDCCACACADLRYGETAALSSYLHRLES